MSWESKPVIKEEVKAELQLILIESIVGGREESWKEVLRLFKDKDKFPTSSTKASVLDFSCEQANGCKGLDQRRKLSLDGKPRYRTYSPLMVAVEENNHDLVKKLLDAGASVGFKNKDRRTVLHIACKSGNTDLVQCLLEKAETQSVYNRHPLSNDCGVIINSKHRPNGWTPLMYAVLEEHLDVMKILMRSKHLNLNGTNKKEQNVFHIAAREGKYECLKELCSDKRKERDIKAAVTASDKKKWNILHQACSQTNPEILEWLLTTFEPLRSEQWINQKSLVVDKKDKKGDKEKKEKDSKKSPTGSYTPFLVACEYKKLDMVKCLEKHISLEKMMAVTCTKNGRAGITALHLAAAHDDEDLMKYLVEESAAQQEPSTEDASELVRRQHDILKKAIDGKGNSVLHVAMESGSRRAAKYIREKCKELETVRNKVGEVPREIVFYIPPEIKDMGPDAVRAYKKALDEGSCPIPYYSMLILGEERVGKTSLYRQLVGKTFIKNLDPTCGIENNTVETVDIKIISLKDTQEWKEVPSDSSDAFANAITDEAIKHMPEIKEEEKKEFMARTNHFLINRVKELEKLMAPPPPPPKVKPLVRSEPEAASVQYSQVPFENVNVPPPRPVAPPIRAREPLVPLSTGQRSIPQVVSEVKRVTTSSVKPTVPSSGAAAYTELPSSIQHRKIEESPIEPKKDKTRNAPDGPSSVKKSEERFKKEKKEPGVLNRRQSVFMAKSLKRRIKGEGFPELNLNTLDFAGQPEYRPMHHCFIARRAFYLVVFNAVNMAEYFQKKDKKEITKDHFEEVRYWIHSINAHIYPPSPKGSDGDETLARVILVGTHRNNCSEEDLRRIDKELDDLHKDSRCVNHLFKLKSIGLKYCNFIPVENSFDKAEKGEYYLRDSHTCDVQESIKTLSKKLPFLEEEYPIKWLNFMEHIESLQATSPVITMDDLLDRAKQLDIKDPKLAVEYLHKSSKIICLEYIPRVFITNDQYEKLKNLVIIYPRWMISVMRKIVELDHEQNYDNILSSSLRSLGEFGIAHQHLLQQRWKEELTDKVQLNHICSILQAYCLIIPIKASISRTKKVNGSLEKDEAKYLIPCKIPDVVIEESTEHFDFTVIFDFDLFLPVVVYHRLIGRLVLQADHRGMYFSKNECIINEAEDLDWWIKYHGTRYMLEISFRGSNNNVEDMKKAHKHLLEVCENSGLKGLKYQCCLYRECTNSKCKKKGPVTCAKYGNGEEVMVISVCGNQKVSGRCSFCKKTIEISFENCGCTGLLEKCLSVDDLSDVYEMVYEGRNKWYAIGLALKVSPHDLDVIGSKGDVGQCCLDMLKKWLQVGTNKNYKTLTEALGSITVGYRDLKEKILEKISLKK